MEVTPTSYRTLATLPRKCLGDGLGLDQRSGAFYSANEGDFLPGRGRVYRIQSGNVTEVVKRGFSDDGVFIDQDAGVVYASEVADFETHKILVIDSRLGKKVAILEPSAGVHSLDDFSVLPMASGPPCIVGADFYGGRVVALRGWLQGSTAKPAATTILSGVRSPTSARLGCDSNSTSGLSNRLLFVTEGGGLTKGTKDRRVLAVPFDALQQCPGDLPKR